jgi:hypothetical protein
LRFALPEVRLCDDEGIVGAVALEGHDHGVPFVEEEEPTGFLKSFNIPCLGTEVGGPRQDFDADRVDSDMALEMHEIRPERDPWGRCGAMMPASVWTRFAVGSSAKAFASYAIK